MNAEYKWIASRMDNAASVWIYNIQVNDEKDPIGKANLMELNQM